MLAEFITTSGAFSPEQQQIMLEILRYDVFIDIPGWYPSWLKWQSEALFEELSAFWRNEELVHKYVPNYKFASWRQIHKLYPIEKFNYTPVGERKDFYLLIDCSEEEQRNIILDL